MSLRGQRFELDLDADEFTPKPLRSPTEQPTPNFSLIGEIKERIPQAHPTAPRPKNSKTGFPAHKKRSNVSAFKQQRSAQNAELSGRGGLPEHTLKTEKSLQNPPSDKAIAHHIGKKYGYDLDAQEKQEISEENKRKIAEMSEEDIEEARAELMSSLNPAFIERLLKRANIDDEPKDEGSGNRLDVQEHSPQDSSNLANAARGPLAQPESTVSPPPSQSDLHLVPPIHFPQPPPPIDPSIFQSLDPSSPNFLNDLKAHYFPSTPHDPSSMTWLTSPTEEENLESPYNPSRDSYQISSLRFSFTGSLIPPTESLNIPVDKGLHHHGLAPSSAGYTIPELAILARSTMPTQRCIAYQILGRLMYRLGVGQFGVKGGEMYEGLWEVIERERVVELMMGEANRINGHGSAKAYAVEALWLWRKGCGGERGLLKEGEKRAK